ncbi:hypothetical protein FLONG3_9660 [Fusarium longipes]|uniref:DUF2293 domain-containing protein n=1 Tax=Fusarium longipes TaxID=694270 RepID=A0A395RVS8_9HYPO|nr:hypothetical protein FLONG3_9660 [Fusarium longipes]
MGREKRNLPAAVAGGPKERHRRAQRSQFDHAAPVPTGFVAKPALPKTTKHHSYFEFVENKDKKKKLEFQITTKKTPPPGFEFVPAGNPELTTACKELSREKDAMIFIVSSIEHMLPATRDAPEPIPKSQEEYDAQVDAALRDLFPRIPNTDRQMIIEHAFRRDPMNKSEKEKVGFSEDITLARRVQLAVLAHIRHTHTRYDTLLRETSWQNARKVVENLCLDTLVKWRGDEESGRDQLDEILREVVVISDSEGEESGNESDSSIEEVVYQPTNHISNRPVQHISGQAGPGHRQSPRLSLGAKGPVTPKAKGKVKKAKRKTSAEKKGQRGFKRYQAWQDALDRSRNGPNDAPASPQGHGSQYTQAPPPAAPVSLDESLPPASQLRLVSGAGPAPYENGYVGKPQYPANARFISSGPQVARKVKSPYYEPPPTTRPPVSMAADRLQDMLVQSIEPASPNAMKPSFVRAVPPRGQCFRNEPPQSSSIQRPAIITPPPRRMDIRDEPVQVSRHIPSERLAYGERPYEFPVRAPSPQPGVGISSAPLHRYDTRSRGVQNPARILVSRRPYDEVQRFGDRDTPIVMEDRGGFYERVPVRSTVDIAMPSRDERVPEYRRDIPELPRALDDRRAIWQEEPRLSLASRSNADVDMIPIGRAPLESRQRPVLTEPWAAPYPISAPRAQSDIRSYFEPEPRLVRYIPPGPESRPVVSGSMAPHYETLREIRQDERVPETFQHWEPVHRYYRDRPVTEDRRRPPPLQSRPTDDVIVLE